MSPGHFMPGMAKQGKGPGSMLCIGVVPNGDGSFRLYFMSCYADGSVEFYEDPDSKCGPQAREATC